MAWLKEAMAALTKSRVALKAGTNLEHALAECLKADGTFRAFSPGQAKKIGRTLLLRLDWDAMSESFMVKLQERKYANTEMAERLLTTGDVPIVELNTWGDTNWGAVEHGGQIGGHNELGLIPEGLHTALMAERVLDLPSPA
jgi:predicted NAD-dependent protein-ADP-ribosyltransferase YbiA (DUF1768 family)